MSWHYEHRVRSKARALSLVHEIRKNNESHFPASAAAALVSALSDLPDVEGHVYYFKTNGHVDGRVGHSSLEVRIEPVTH